MIQTIIVLFFIAAALFFVIWKIIQQIRQKKSGSPCDDCDGCNLKSEWMKNQIISSHKPTKKCT
jgi:large-conductance mechanosensitive channel